MRSSDIISRIFVSLATIRRTVAEFRYNGFFSAAASPSIFAIANFLSGSHHDIRIGHTDGLVPSQRFEFGPNGRTISNDSGSIL